MRFTFILLAALAALTVSGADSRSLFRTNRTVRTLSLDDCIRQALERSPRLKVRRFDPALSRYSLDAARGFYDPEFLLNYSHRNTSSAGRFDPATGTERSSTVSEGDIIRPGLRGALPSGLTYIFSGDLSHNRGTQEGDRFENYEADVGIQLQQPLLRDFWANQAQTDIQVAKRDVKISELDVEEEVRLVVRDVHAAYYDLVAAYETITVGETNVVLAAVLLDTANKQAAVGRIAAVDTNQPLATLKTAQADLLDYQQRHRAFENLLKSLITDDYQSWLNVRLELTDKLTTVPERLDLDALQESWVSALNNRPNLRQSALTVEKLELERKLRFNQLFPSLNVVGGYGRNGLDSYSPGSTNFFVPIGDPPIVTPPHNASFPGAVDGVRQELNPSWNVGFNLSYPLGNRSARARNQSARAAVQQTEAEAQLLKHVILVEVQDAMEAALAARERISARWQAAQAAEIALNAERDRVKAGASTFVQVTEVQNDYITALSQHINALATYNKALVALYYRDGTILERNKISVQFK